MRVPKGYRRNERSPFRALKRGAKLLMSGPICGRNERSPFRALKLKVTIANTAVTTAVEMKEARSGR